MMLSLFEFGHRDPPWTCPHPDCRSLRRQFLLGVGVLALLFGAIAFILFTVFVPSINAEDMKLVKRGAYLYNTSKPACSSCHTQKRNSLADYGSRGSIAEAKDWLRRPNRQFEKAGKKGLMPAYKMPDGDVEALARYLMTLEE